MRSCHLTGFGTGGWPPSALKWCARVATKPIIFDGGIRHHGDIAKSVRFDAAMVMVGSLFAGHEEGPAATMEVDGRRYKAYYGSASDFNKGEYRHLLADDDVQRREDEKTDQERSLVKHRRRQAGGLEDRLEKRSDRRLAARASTRDPRALTWANSAATKKHIGRQQQHHRDQTARPASHESIPPAVWTAVASWHGACPRTSAGAGTADSSILLCKLRAWVLGPDRARQSG